MGFTGYECRMAFPGTQFGNLSYKEQRIPGLQLGVG